MEELDNLITYIENDLIGDNDDMQLIDEGIKRYAELYHKKELIKIKSNIITGFNKTKTFDKAEARIIVMRFTN
jgi:hypothetical protein